MFKPSLEALEDRTMPSGFGILPPEINSAFMYAGAGSGPLLAAASAWNGLAADLQAAATSYGAVISGLSGGGWSGPALATTTNRAQLPSLIATNVLGQNTPAIAETEAHYMEMWVQDAASFAGYIDRHA